MKNHRKSKRALSPVVASIILIAVTVAVSIAVAAWMGALTIGFMGAEQCKITNVEFNSAGSPGVVLTLRNTGDTAVTIQDCYAGSTLMAVTYLSDDATTLGVVQPNGVLKITAAAQEWDAGTAYQFKVVSAKGNPFVYTATAPT
jgi:flagellin-like protein